MDQMNIFDKPHKQTYREYLQTLKTGEEVVKFLLFVKNGCRQTTKQEWHDICFKEEYRGEHGCMKCRADFWDMEANFEPFEELRRKRGFDYL